MADRLHHLATQPEEEPLNTLERDVIGRGDRG
jgi:hypothetical protein